MNLAGTDVGEVGDVGEAVGHDSSMDYHCVTNGSKAHEVELGGVVDAGCARVWTDVVGGVDVDGNSCADAGAGADVVKGEEDGVESATVPDDLDYGVLGKGVLERWSYCGSVMGVHKMAPTRPQTSHSRRMHGDYDYDVHRQFRSNDHANHSRRPHLTLHHVSCLSLIKVKVFKL